MYNTFRVIETMQTDISAFVLLICVTVGQADYTCVCNYGPDVAVHAAPDSAATVIGHLYEPACKEFVPKSHLDRAWLAIAYSHMAGYVLRGSRGFVQIESCAGNPPANDSLLQIVTTAVPPQTTVMPTTPTHSTNTVTNVTTSTSTIPTISLPSSTTSTATPTISTTMSSSTVSAPTTSTTMLSSTVSASTTPIMTTTTFAPFTAMHNPDGNIQICTHRLPVADPNHVIIGEMGGYCYELLTNQKVGWQHAESICKHGHGHLASITSAEEQSFVQDFLTRHRPRNAVWIGLHDSRVESHFEWTTHDQVTYTNWVPGHTGDYASPTYEDCVALIPYKGGQWDDITCGITGFAGSTDSGEAHYPLCKYKAEDTSSVDLTTPSNSGNGASFVCKSPSPRDNVITTQLGSTCYELYPDRKVSWTRGAQICSTANGYMGSGHLVSIGSAAEQAMLQAFLQRHSPDQAVWIGLNDRRQEGHFEWSNGQRVTYTNWVPGHTDNFVGHSQEDCVAIIPYKGGQWDDVSCGSDSTFAGSNGEVHPILCEYKSTTQVFVG